MNKGILTLIPTPIAEDIKLDEFTFRVLNEAALSQADQSLFVIEDLKPGRRRWLNFGLPRSTVDNFVLYNEHNSSEASEFLLKELNNGKNVYLMSDGGLPAFYDPGIELVRNCHRHGIKVTSTPFHNSMILALALSGFSHQKFWFEGFLPTESHQRMVIIEKLLMQKHTSILMDTPYRLKRLLEEIHEVSKKCARSKLLFVAMDLNSSSQELLLGSAQDLLHQIRDFKREFILIISE